MFTVLHILVDIIHIKPLTALVFLIIGTGAVCAWAVGITALCYGCYQLKFVIRRSNAVKVCAWLVIVGFFGFVILAPILDSMAQPTATVCRTLSECNRMVPLVPGTTLQQGREGQQHVQAPRYYEAPNDSKSPFFIVDPNPQTRT